MVSTIPQTKELRPLEKNTVLHTDRRNTLPRLKKSAQEFESMLYQMMFKSMRATIQKNPMFHGGQAEDTFQEMTDLEISKNIAGTRSFGLADAIVRDYKKYITVMDADKTTAKVSDAAQSDKPADPKQAEKAAEAQKKLRSLENRARAAQTDSPDAAANMRHLFGGNAQPSNVNARLGAVAKKAYASAGK